MAAVLASGFAILFRSALSAVARALGGDNIVAALTLAPTWLRVLLPALGGLGAGTIAHSLGKRADHGVGDVMEAVVLGRVGLSLRAALVRSLASFCAIASGGSLGREGPLIQFGAIGGKLASDWLRLGSRRRRLLIAAGTAAGFTAAYNTPFAAVLFVLEVVLGVVVVEAIVPTLAATVISTALTRAVVGPGPIYGVRAFFLHSSWELLAFAVLGGLTAGAAQGFMRLLSFGERCFTHPKLRLPWRPALGGLGAGLLISVLPEVAGNGYEPLNQLLDARFTFGFVLLLLLAKCLATTSSVSSGNPGGVFTPTLLVGGAVGYLYFGLLHGPLHFNVGAAGGYALVGMAAATAATTHAPLMAALLGFELSGDYAIALPLILATSIATAASRRLRKDSIYTAELRRKGLGWEWTLEGRRSGV
jgi:CIC family chloride channel protein